MSLGFATPSKRIDLILEALAEARSGLPDFEFWVVGEVHAPAGFRRGVAARGLEDRVRSTGYVPLDRFQLAIQAADVVISLRYPTAGESSAAQMRALGMGRATLSFDYAGFADTPADAGVKIPLDTRSATPLARALLRLGRDAGLRDRLGRAAAAWVAEHCSPQGCAAACGDLIRETSSLSSTPP